MNHVFELHSIRSTCTNDYVNQNKLTLHLLVCDSVIIQSNLEAIVSEDNLSGNDMQWHLPSSMSTTST